MKRSIFLAGILLLVITHSFAQNLSTDKIVGVWLTEDKKLKIEIFRSGNTYSGRQLWAEDMFEADGKTPKKDEHNPDKNLRNRSRQGIVTITGLTYQDGEYVDGKLYRPQDGNTYSLKGKLKSENKLETRGYRGTPMLGKTFKWTRVQQ